jgi:hypothetical protein
MRCKKLTYWIFAVLVVMLAIFVTVRVHDEDEKREEYCLYKSLQKMLRSFYSNNKV